MLFRPSLTKVSIWIILFLKAFAICIQTGSEVISQQIFQISTPNLVCTWKTLQHVPMCKGNFISSKMIDIKQIALIANAKIMLYTFFIQKVILWFNHKFIWRHLRMFSTQIWKKVDCKMKSRFLVNIWNMHAWLIATTISSVMSPSLSFSPSLSALFTSSLPQIHGFV